MMIFLSIFPSRGDKDSRSVKFGGVLPSVPLELGAVVVVTKTALSCSVELFAGGEAQHFVFAVALGSSLGLLAARPVGGGLARCIIVGPDVAPLLQLGDKQIDDFDECARRSGAVKAFKLAEKDLPVSVSPSGAHYAKL